MAIALGAFAAYVYTSGQTAELLTAGQGLLQKTTSVIQESVYRDNSGFLKNTTDRLQNIRNSL